MYVCVHCSGYSALDFLHGTFKYWFSSGALHSARFGAQSDALCTYLVGGGGGVCSYSSVLEGSGSFLSSLSLYGDWCIFVDHSGASGSRGVTWWCQKVVLSSRETTPRRNSRRQEIQQQTGCRRDRPEL